MSSKPPPPKIFFALHTGLGLWASTFCGRTVGTTASLLELRPTVAVVCLFLASYQTFDTMAAGMAKQEAGLQDIKQGDIKHNEKAYLAQRAQSNQVEQMPVFIVSSLAFSAFVNANIGALLASAWTILRTKYALAYRSSMGKTFHESQVTKYAVPCYFINGTMLFRNDLPLYKGNIDPELSFYWICL